MKRILSILICGVLLLGLTGCGGNTSNDVGSTSNNKKLKLTNDMISDIKREVRNISTSTEAAIISATLGDHYNSVKIIDHGLSDAYTYTVYLKATGVNGADYINYKIKYTAVKDKTGGYSIEENYDFH